MRARRWQLGAVVAVVAIGAFLVTHLGTNPNPTVRTDVRLVYRLVDAPSAMPLGQARDAAVQVITRRLASHGFSAEVSAGLATDPIEVRVTHADPAQVAAIVERDGRRFTLWKWEPGEPELAVLAQLNRVDVTRHPGYRPVFTGLDGTMIRVATARSQDTMDGRPDVVVALDSTGAQLLDEVTKDRVARPQNSVENKVAIFIDGKLFEDANVLTEISGGALLLVPDGSFAFPADARRLADDINAGTVPGRLVRVTVGGATTMTP
jgi:preprotein translocase subunit SecD